jgi:hypothetical protein
MFNYCIALRDSCSAKDKVPHQSSVPFGRIAWEKGAKIENKPNIMEYNL